MIRNFHKVRDNLFRGAAPTPKDIVTLKKKLGVEKIISLDAKVGEGIAPFCDKLGIDHIIIDINAGEISSLKNLLKSNIHDLVDESIPTFIHCLHGKDRAGLFIALVRCILDNYDCRDAIKEAKKYGFGTGIDERIERFYTKLISKACQHDHKDSNHVYDVVTDTRNSYEESTLNPYAISWGLYADPSVRMFPYASVNLTEYDDHGATREEYALKGIKEEMLESNHMPLVGIYDQNTQITNVVGPSLMGGGFVQ